MKDTYLPIPNQREALDCLEDAGLTVLETFQQSRLFKESDAVMDFSSDCHFWIVQKNDHSNFYGHF